MDGGARLPGDETRDGTRPLLGGSLDWRDYEQHIFQSLRKQFPETELVCSVRLDGRISGIKRQIDILARGQLMDARPLAVVDCKYFSREVDITVVESFLGLLTDVGAHIGILITNVGYSEAAIRRAENDQTKDLRLHVVQVSKLNTLPTYRLIYFGDVGVRVAIPHQWDIFDGQVRIPGIASWDLLPRFIGRDAAYRLPRWGCISLVPVADQPVEHFARDLLARQHAVAQQRGRVQYRAEDWGTGDITYQRTSMPGEEVGFFAICAARGVIVAIEIQTTREHMSKDEAMMVEIARSMLVAKLEGLEATESPEEAWESAIGGRSAVTSDQMSGKADDK
jgi:restriction endonuclease